MSWKSNALRACAYAPLMLAWTGTAYAQNAPSDENSDAIELETIVVTATKRATDLQDVPFSISAVSSETIQRANVKTLADLTTLAAGVSLPGINAVNSGTPAIRGGYQASAFPGVDQDVGVFVDEVYASGIGDTLEDYVDIDRVEILRGPQGTLFGRNVTGGAVSVHTRRPSFTPETSVTLGYGNNNDYDARLFSTGPFSDTLAYKLSARFTGNDGSLHNAFLGGRAGKSDNASVRGQILIKPNDGLSILLGGDLYHRRADQAAQNFGNIQPPGPIWPAMSYDEDATNVNIPGHPNGYLRTTHYNFLARIDWDFGDATLTSISASRNLNQKAINETPGDPLNVNTVTQPMANHQFTQELRLTSPDNHPFRWVVGLYYLWGSRFFSADARLDYRPFSGLPAASRPFIGNALGGTPALTNLNAFLRQTSKTESEAIFAEANYDLTSTLTFTLGARYTFEHKYGINDRSNQNSFLSGPPMAARYSKKWGAFTPKATLTFSPTDDIMMYATAVRGFKSGGVDVTTASTPAALDDLVDPTFVWNYEIGAKTKWLDGRLVANVSLYRMDYTDLQVRVWDPTTGSFNLRNAGNARDQGIEVELTARPLDWLTLGTAYAYQDAKYKDYVVVNRPPAPPSDLSGNRMIQTPRHQLSVYGDVNFEGPGGGAVTVGGNVLYRSSVWFTDANNDPAYVHDRARVKSLLNLHASWTSANDRWEVALWGKNVTNERYLTLWTDLTAFFFPLGAAGAGNSIGNALWNAPRTYGFTVSHKF